MTEEEDRLVQGARAGDRAALEALLEPWRKPLFGYIYRMVTSREDAEDLLQETLARAIEQIARFRGEARFKSWLFGIATHVSLDHLRRKKRWRVETQIEGEARARADPERMAGVRAMMARPDFAFEIREHIAFCFSCLARSLEPEKEAALFLIGSDGIHRRGRGLDSRSLGAEVPPSSLGRAKRDDRGL
jgi:RNA polymerase sigma-70 factor (ECF subfamily)